MKRVKRAQLVTAGELRRCFDEALINLDHGEGRPFVSDGPGAFLTNHETDRADRLDEGDAASEPQVGIAHRAAHDVAAHLGDVALHQSARVEIEVQRSASRSARTCALADPFAFTRRGARVGFGRVGGATRPVATSSRRCSSAEDDFGGTRSATGRPRTVIRTRSPRATARRVALNDALSSRAPISRMCPHYYACGHIPYPDGRGSLPPVATVIPIDDLRRSPTASLFQGKDDVPVSIFVTKYHRGQGPDLHFHPYPEVFVVETGTATFTAGEEELTVSEGHIVVVPAETPHGFKGAGDDTLRVVSVHPSGTVQQTDL